MSADVILYILLVLSLVTSLIAAKMTAHIRGLVRWKIGTGGTLFMLAAGLVSTGLYVWLAVVTGYWQFAAIHVGQFLINYAAGAGAPQIKRDGAA